MVQSYIILARATIIVFCLSRDRCGCNTTSQTEMASYLCHHGHKVCGSGLVIQSLTRFDSQNPVVSINRKLGKWRGLVVDKITKNKSINH